MDEIYLIFKHIIYDLWAPSIADIMVQHFIQLRQLRKHTSEVYRAWICVIHISEVDCRHSGLYMYEKVNKCEDNSIIIHILRNYLIVQYCFLHDVCFNTS